MSADKRKKLLNALFFLVVFGLTVWAFLFGADPKALLHSLSKVQPVFILASILCVLLYIFCDSILFYYLLRRLGFYPKLFRCCLYSFIGFFYCCITPSASGGQPMQLLAMRRDGLPVAHSTVVLAIITIAYKLILVLLGAAVILLRPPGVMRYLRPIDAMVYLGLVLNIAFIAVLFLLLFNPSAVRRMANGVFRLIHKLRPFRNLQQMEQRLERVIEQYQGAAAFYRSNKGIFLNVLLVTFLQRFSLFSVTWLVYLSFGLSGHNILLITTLQGMISVAVDMLPLPGGMGISEALFLGVFTPIFGRALALPGMILSRGISFYTQLLISGIMTVAARFLLRRPSSAHHK